MIERIREHFETFPVSSRDQLLRRFYQGRNDRTAVRKINEKLRKLVDRQQLDVNREIKPYVYFSVPRRIPLRSAALSHHLAVVSFFLMVESFSRRRNLSDPLVVALEQGFGKGYPRPDLILEWQNRFHYVEIQRTVTSNRRMQTKVKEYEKLVADAKYKEMSERFDSLWIVGSKRYQLDTKLPIEYYLTKL